MHAAAFRALGLPHTYERLETSEADLPARIDSLRRGEYGGLNVTVPHKARVLSLVDEVAPSARIVGAANTLVRSDDGHITAHNTDAIALTGEIVTLRVESSGVPSRPRYEGAELQALTDALVRAGRTTLVLGSGGAARAAVAAAATRRIIVRARAFKDPARAADFERSLRDTLRPATAVEADAVKRSVEEMRSRGVKVDVDFAELEGPTSIVASPLVASPEQDATVSCIIQATSCGMSNGPPGDVVAEAVAWEAVPKNAIAIDVVYAPRDTPFLRAARAQGIAARDGLGMLARQGALAFQLWLGVEPPLEAMRAAIE
jgi:shikimate dehydrogenase